MKIIQNGLRVLIFLISGFHSEIRSGRMASLLRQIVSSYLPAASEGGIPIVFRIYLIISYITNERPQTSEGHFNQVFTECYLIHCYHFIVRFDRGKIRTTQLSLMWYL